MPPGQYLERRRLMAGYSLSSLARKLLLLTGLGASRAESDFRRLRLTLISAEQGSIHHSRDRIELIRAFIPLDVSLYLHLVDCEKSGDPYRVSGLCRSCACSFHDPCVLHVGPTAMLGASTCLTGEDLCSACEGLAQRLTPELFRSVGREGPTIAEQLRELGERMHRISRAEDERAAVRALDTRTFADPPILSVVPNTGDK